MEKEIDLSICIVSFNVKEYLDICLSSIYENIKELNFEVFVVDNNSKDGSPELIKEKYKDVIFFELNENIGFAKANNMMLEKANGKYMLLLNPDTKILPKSLELMISCLESNSNIGILGPKLLNQDDSIQNGIRAFPRLLPAISRNTLLRFLPFFSKTIKDYHLRHIDLNIEQNVDQVSGACMLFKKELMNEIGILDDRFFMFFEEVDYCKRAKDYGYKVYYYSKPSIYHFGGKSSNGFNPLIKIYHLQSQLLYLKKHSNTFNYFIFIITFKILYIVSIFFEVLIDILIIPIYFLASIFKNSKVNKKYSKRKQKALFRLFFIKNYLIKFVLKM